MDDASNYKLAFKVISPLLCAGRAIFPPLEVIKDVCDKMEELTDAANNNIERVAKLSDAAKRFAVLIFETAKSLDDGSLAVIERISSLYEGELQDIIYKLVPTKKKTRFKKILAFFAASDIESRISSLESKLREYTGELSMQVTVRAAAILFQDVEERTRAMDLLLRVSSDLKAIVDNRSEATFASAVPGGEENRTRVLLDLHQHADKLNLSKDDEEVLKERLEAELKADHAYGPTVFLDTLRACDDLPTLWVDWFGEEDQVTALRFKQAFEAEVGPQTREVMVALLNSFAWPSPNYNPWTSSDLVHRDKWTTFIATLSLDTTSVEDAVSEDVALQKLLRVWGVWDASNPPQLENPRKLKFSGGKFPAIQGSCLLNACLTDEVQDHEATVKSFRFGWAHTTTRKDRTVALLEACRAFSEMLFLARAQSSNVVGLLGVHVSPRSPSLKELPTQIWIVMERCPVSLWGKYEEHLKGPDLWVQDPVWVLSVLRWMLEAARALKQLHALKPAILHRDLKPDNIMLDRDGRVKVIDFGVSREGTESGATIIGGTVVGTHGFMPPETRANGKFGRRSDVYSFVVTLVRMLVGPRFKGGGNPAAVAPMLHQRAGVSTEVIELVKVGLGAYEQRPLFEEVVPLLEKAVQAAAAHAKTVTGVTDPGLKAWLERIKLKDCPQAVQALEEMGASNQDALVELAEDPELMKALGKAMEAYGMKGIQKKRLQKALEQLKASRPPPPPAPAPAPDAAAMWSQRDFSGLVGLLSSPASESVRLEAVKCLKDLAAEKAENRVTIAAAGAIKPLVSLLGGQEGGEELLRVVVDVLQLLSNNNAYNSVDIVAAGAIKPLLTMLGGMVGEPLKVAAAKFLWILSFNADNRAAIAAAGAIPPLVALLGGQGGEQLKLVVSQVITKLALNGDNKATIIAAGAIPPLKALRDGEGGGNLKAEAGKVVDRLLA